MSDLSKMTGTVWHVDRFIRQEGDDRRHRARCINYTGKGEGYCAYYCEKCRGASHCQMYAEIHINSGNENEEYKNLSRKQAFNGLKYIPVSEIVVESKYIDHSPRDKKVKKALEQYMKYGNFTKPVIISYDCGDYVLTDGYMQFFIAKKLGLHEIPAEMGTKEEIKLFHLLRKKGTIVRNEKNLDLGKVIESSINRTKIKWDSGKEVLYDIYGAARSGLIKVWDE